MNNRELGLDEIYRRVSDARETLGLKAFKRTPTSAIDEKYLPCVFMIEGLDEVIDISQRNKFGYPMRRQFEVVLEIVTEGAFDVKKLYRDVRTVILTETPTVADGTFIREIRTEGPTGYGLPNMLGMRLVFLMFYTDDGT